MQMIEVNGIKKYYKVAKRDKGITSSVKHLFHRNYQVKKAVDDISFSIKKGEIVGFIGPNGAGKSTTIKMLSGILYPDEGKLQINGYIPYKQRKQYVKNIGVVFGQKSQLHWDLPLIESFELMKYIYKIPQNLYEENLEKFTKLLDMENFINQPVRQLSLGQRMRGDIVAALLHSPEIVFFDEPTIGLDVVAKEKIREFIKYMNETEQTTIIFTTHDMQDIEKVCDRLIIIDEGKKIYDGTIDGIKNKYANSKTIEILLENGEKEVKTFDINKTPMNEVMEGLFSKYHIKDISICEPEIDEIIRDIYEGRVALKTTDGKVGEI
ncbi:MAG: ATP-binding cassette domain-containing protein [Lachnospiraceae bacterium]|nr:ATP-binding cassette domain-containing protein [Lachnospiraceae bacterium]